MTKIVCPLAGAYHRPPARQLLGVAALGTPLLLVPEFDNPWDSKAMRVYMAWEDISAAAYEKLEADLVGTGWTNEEVAEASPLHVGYLGKSGGKVCLGMGLQGNAEVLQMLGFFDDEEGVPQTPMGWDWEREHGADGRLRASLGVSADGKHTVVVEWLG